MTPSDRRTGPRPPAGAREGVCDGLHVDPARVATVAAGMPDDAAIAQVIGAYKVLSDPTRARIVFALSQAELCVCDLASLVGISVSAVSHQLRLLRSLGLVRFRKEGRLAYYALSDAHVERLLADALAHAEHLRAEAAR